MKNQKNGLILKKKKKILQILRKIKMKPKN